MIVNLAWLVISIHCYVSLRSQYLVRRLSLCWTTGGHRIHPAIEVLLAPTGSKPTPFRNLVSKVAGLQVHATTPGEISKPTPFRNLASKVAGLQVHATTPGDISY